MKIISTSNVDDSTISDRLVASSIDSQYELQLMLRALRGGLSRRDTRWYEAVPDNHELYTYDPSKPPAGRR